jgi:hypothetical protein
VAPTVVGTWRVTQRWRAVFHDDVGAFFPLINRPPSFLSMKMTSLVLFQKMVYIWRGQLPITHKRQNQTQVKKQGLPYTSLQK